MRKSCVGHAWGNEQLFLTGFAGLFMPLQLQHMHE